MVDGNETHKLIADLNKEILNLYKEHGKLKAETEVLKTELSATDIALMIGFVIYNVLYCVSLYFLKH